MRSSFDFLSKKVKMFRHQTAKESNEFKKSSIETKGEIFGSCAVFRASVLYVNQVL